MGLAGRKQKQRIPTDPRNLTWADDASRFGHAYLSKFGWDASQGLGSSGDGVKTHIKVQQKLDMMGIGAQHQRDPSGIAWKQNKEFEALLKRLNENAEQEKGEGDHEETMIKGFVRTQEKVEEEQEHRSSVTTKKRKDKDSDDSDTSKKQKKEKRKKSSSDVPAVPALDAPSESSTVLPLPGESSHKPRPMAHRARIRAAKRISDKSATAISEILGIAPPSSVPTSSTPSPAPTPPSTLAHDAQLSLSLDNLTTSTKSITDYFKEKLATRSTAATVSASSSSFALSGSASPGLGLLNTTPSDDDEPRRRGIGSQGPSADVSGRDTSMEKPRQMAEKRKRREAEAASPDGLSPDVKEQTDEGDTERAKETSKKDKKQKKRSERGQQVASADQTNHNDDEGVDEKSRGHDTPSGFLRLEPSKKSKKGHKRKPS